MYEWIVVISARFTPKVSCRTFATGARQFVVHEPHEMMWCLAGVVRLGVHAEDDGDVVALRGRAR